MIKSLALKTEAVNAYCSRSHEIDATIKEVCFDIELLLVEFITSSIKQIRHIGRTRRPLRLKHTLVLTKSRASDKQQAVLWTWSR